MIGGMIVQHHVQQRPVNLDPSAVFDKPEFAKSIHEEAHAGAGGADHLRESLLRDFGNDSFRFARLAELSHQQQNPRQPLLAGVEELVDQIGLNAHTSH